MNRLTQVVLVLLSAVALYYVITSYRTSRQTPQLQEKFEDYEEFYAAAGTPTPSESKTAVTAPLPPNEPVAVVTVPSTTETVLPAPAYNVVPSLGVADNEVFYPVDSKDDAGEFVLGTNQYPKDCFPKDQLTPAELLPGDANSKWAQSVPAGQGELGDQNYLTAGYHIGIDTVGQTLRNANRQLRSEPPNPQVKVSPWLQTTIEPDTNRRPLEIGGCA